MQGLGTFLLCARYLLWTKVVEKASEQPLVLNAEEKREFWFGRQEWDHGVAS